jgi:DNA-binding NarL/FixJ family response regulator
MPRARTTTSRSPAFEWLAGRVARMLNRDREDQESLRVLEGRDEESVARYQALTPAQQGVARLLADGLTNGSIASRLSLTPSTVKSHIAAITRKYGMSREQTATDIRSYLRRPDAIRPA